MTDFFDMLSAVVYVAVPALVGTGLLVIFAGWLIGLWHKTMTAMDEVRQSNMEVQYQAAIKSLDLQRQGLQVDLIRPDVNGLLPVSRAALDAHPRALITLASQYIDSRKALPVMPTNLHYAPHFAPGKGEQPKALEVAELPQLMATDQPKIKDFWAAYHSGSLPDDSFLLGYDLETNEPVTATWRNLYSCLVVGQSGSGKSTLLRSILAQAALQGARFAVIDPHLDAGEESLAYSLRPLQNLMPLPAAGEDASIRDTLKYVTTTAKNRLSGQDQDRNPLILIVDETTSMLARGNVKQELLDTLGLIAQESRKVGVYAICLLQQAQAELFPSTVRNSFVSYLATRARRDSVRCATGSTTMAKIAEELTIGEAAWMTPSGEMHRIAVPNCTEKHLTLVAKSLSNGHYTAEPEPLHLPLHSPLPTNAKTGTHDTSIKSDDSGHGSGDGSGSHTSSPQLIADPARLALVRELIKGGKSRGQILSDVWGISKAGGNAWKQAAEQLDEIIRSLIN